MAHFELDQNIGRKARVMREQAREFGREVARPIGIELDKLKDPADVIAKGSRLWEVFRKYRELGFHKTMIPPAFGGTMGKGGSGVHLVAEELGYWDAGLAISMEVANMPFAFAILSEAAEVRDWARQYCDDKEGDMVGCWAITEPDHGTDWVMATTQEGKDPRTAPNLKAVKKGKEYVLNGWKAAWVSNGTIATHAVLHVGLDQSQGMHGSGLAMCPLDLPGVSKGKPLDKIGQRPLNQGEIIFEDVVIPEKYMLLKAPGLFTANAFGKGFLGVANSQMGLVFSGLARAVLDEALNFAKENSSNGKPLCDRQEVRLKLFEMFKMAEAARAFAFAVMSVSPLGRSNPVMRLFTSTRATFWAMGKSISRAQDLYLKHKDNPKLVAFMEKRAQKKKPGKDIKDWGRFGVASKVLATDTAFHNANLAIQIMGDAGISTDHVMEKMFRDARAAQIEDGANESLGLAAAESLVT